MRRYLAASLLLLPLPAGCGSHPEPALQPGDVVRPRIAVAPEAFWPEGARATVGALLEVHRPGRPESADLEDKDVPVDAAVMRARVTWMKGGSPLGEPLEVPFVKDC